MSKNSQNNKNTEKLLVITNIFFASLQGDFKVDVVIFLKILIQVTYYLLHDSGVSDFIIWKFYIFRDGPPSRSRVSPNSWLVGLSLGHCNGGSKLVL